MDGTASTSGRSSTNQWVLLFTGGVLVGTAVAAGCAYAYFQYLPGPDVDSRRPRRRVKAGVRYALEAQPGTYYVKANALTGQNFVLLISNHTCGASIIPLLNNVTTNCSAGLTG